MILVCGIPSEAPVAAVIAAAARQGIACVIFNQRQAQHTQLSLHVQAGVARGHLRIQETDFPLEDFNGIYVRLADLRELPEFTRRSAGQASIDKITSLHQALATWLELTSSRVFNRPSDMTSNSSKPYQAQRIIAGGWRTPETLVTNDPALVREFLRVHGRVVYKSTSALRSIVHELDAPKLAELERVRRLPTQFQEYVPGVDIRVHVAEQALFASEVRSTAVDYRYPTAESPVQMTPVDLPEEIAQRCLRLSQSLNLPLCGIDLRRTPQGEYVCFEVNPSPGYTYYQEYTGQDIATAIVRALEGVE